MKMSDVVTSIHNSRSNSAQEERSLEDKNSLKAGGRKLDSDERWVVPHRELKKPSEWSRLRM